MTGYRDTADMLGAAVGYAAAGFEVFPLCGKRPLRDSAGFRDATRDADRIERWWREHPGANIGLRPPAGVIVLDVDPRHGGDAALTRLLDHHGPLPQTWTTRTGSGGTHHWLRTGRNWAPSTLCTGVDVKAYATGYLVAPPSIHPNGSTYVWTRPPGESPAAAPNWLREALQPPQWPPWQQSGDVTGSGGQYSLACLIARIGAAREGDRNRTLYGAARDAWRQGDLDAFAADLIGAAVAAGLPYAEAVATVRSAAGGRP